MATEGDAGDDGHDDYDGDDIWADDDDDAQPGAISAAVNAIESVTLLIPMRDRSTMVERASLSDLNKMILLPTPRDEEGK